MTAIIPSSLWLSYTLEFVDRTFSPVNALVFARTSR